MFRSDDRFRCRNPSNSFAVFFLNSCRSQCFTLFRSNFSRNGWTTTTDRQKLSKVYSSSSSFRLQLLHWIKIENFRYKISSLAPETLWALCAPLSLSLSHSHSHALFLSLSLSLPHLNKRSLCFFYFSCSKASICTCLSFYISLSPNIATLLWCVSVRRVCGARIGFMMNNESGAVFTTIHFLCNLQVGQVCYIALG